MEKDDVWKLECSLEGGRVKMEVKGRKGGMMGEREERKVWEGGERELNMRCKGGRVCYWEV